jgi:hypothetical protein
LVDFDRTVNVVGGVLYRGYETLSRLVIAVVAA